MKAMRTEDKARFDELFSIAFESPLDRSRETKQDENVLMWAAFDDDGEMMSTLCSTKFDMTFDGHSVTMGGIGGVATLPQYRRRGGIRECFKVLLPELYEAGYEFSYLYPFSTDFYRKFGYESCVRKYAVSVDLTLLKKTVTGGHCILADKNHPVGAYIREIDAPWEAKYNISVRHGEEYYSRYDALDPYAEQKFCYVYFKDGKPKAYTVFRLAMQEDGRNLVCSEFGFADREGFEGLMELFKSLAADHKYVKFELPAEPAMMYMMSEWSLGAAMFKIVPSGMVRVINVKKVLELARYKDTGEVSVRVNDGFIGENDKAFRVIFKDGRAESVTECETADIELGIAAFSALISGVCDFSEAKEWFADIKINRPADFDSIFHRKPLMISDYF